MKNHLEEAGRASGKFVQVCLSAAPLGWPHRGRGQRGPMAEAGGGNHPPKCVQGAESQASGKLEVLNAHIEKKESLMLCMLSPEETRKRAN